MKMCHAATDEESKESPLGRGKGRQALGWVVDYGTKPTPALRDRCRCGEGFSSLHPLRGGDFHGNYLPSVGLNAWVRGAAAEPFPALGAE